MALSNDLISQFVKATKDETSKSKETTVYGRVTKYDDMYYVKLDGSDILTPVTTVTDITEGEYVTVMIKNHTATITGNLSSPSAKSEDVKNLGESVQNNITQVGNNITQLENNITQIGDTVKSQGNEITQIGNKVTATDNEITAINNKVNAQGNDITSLGNKITSQSNTIEQLGDTITSHGNTIEQIGNTVVSHNNSIQAINNDIKVYNSSFQIIDGVITGIKGATVEWIKTTELEAGLAKIGNLDVTYAQIDFSNIGEAAIEKLFTESGIIKDLVVSEGHITGQLVGVTIRGDLIEGGTIVADKLVVKGSNGLYYKLNTDGVSVETEQTEYNSLNGSVITAKSITATKINVDDLVAFDATIGGFRITNTSIYSGIKNSATSDTRGIYLDKEGQFAVGDSSNYLRYYKASDGTYKLEVSAASVKFGAKGESVEDVVTEVKENAIVSSVEQFYQSSSPTSLSGGSWDAAQPTWTEGKYIWRRTLITYGDGRTEYTPNQNGVCITGNTGAQGNPGSVGTGISSVTEEYYLSTSKTEQIGGSWNASPPTWSTGKYMWTRSKIVYNNPVSTEYTTPVCDSSWEAVNEVTIGGRNLLQNSTGNAGDLSNWTGDYMTVMEDTDGKPYLNFTRDLTDLTSSAFIDNGSFPKEDISQKEYTISGYYRVNNGVDTTVQIFIRGNAEGDITAASKNVTIPGDGNWHYITASSKGNATPTIDETYPHFQIAVTQGVSVNLDFKNIKVEYGNKPTDWTPAPEDMATSEEVNNAQDTANEAQGTADSTADRVTEVEASLEILNNTISMLVTDENGSSMMTQTSDGWRFDISKIQNGLNDAVGQLSSLTSTMSEAASTIDNLNSLVSDLGAKTAYIIMTTDETGAPCIELGKEDNDFKVRITNTSVDFMDGSLKIAYVSNQKLYIEKAVIKDELYIGELPGFVFKKRTNGNMGLRWEGE